VLPVAGEFIKLTQDTEGASKSIDVFHDATVSLPPKPTMLDGPDARVEATTLQLI